MMGKGTKSPRKAVRSSAKNHSTNDAFREDDIDDEIDACTKQILGPTLFLFLPISYDVFNNLNNSNVQFISSGMLCLSMLMVRLEMIAVTCFQQKIFSDSIVSSVVNFILHMYMTGESDDEDLIEPVFDFEVRNTFWKS